VSITFTDDQVKLMMMMMMMMIAGDL